MRFGALLLWLMLLSPSFAVAAAHQCSDLFAGRRQPIAEWTKPLIDTVENPSLISKLKENLLLRRLNYNNLRSNETYLNWFVERATRLEMRKHDGPLSKYENFSKSERRAALRLTTRSLISSGLNSWMEHQPRRGRSASEVSSFVLRAVTFHPATQFLLNSRLPGQAPILNQRLLNKLLNEGIEKLAIDPEFATAVRQERDHHRRQLIVEKSLSALTFGFAVYLIADQRGQIEDEMEDARKNAYAEEIDSASQINSDDILLKVANDEKAMIQSALEERENRDATNSEKAEIAKYVCSDLGNGLGNKFMSRCLGR